MRLIDADELMTAFPLGEFVRTESVRATIYNMPTIEPHEWIPCSERLPEEDYWTGATFQHYFHHSTYSAYVLMTVFNADDDETIIDYGHTVDGEWYSDTTDCFLPPEWKVLAWMPLPEPYKEEE